LVHLTQAYQPVSCKLREILKNIKISNPIEPHIEATRSLGIVELPVDVMNVLYVGINETEI